MKIKQILNRLYVNDIDNAITFYENLLSEHCTFRFKHSAANLELAQIGNFLIVAGSDEALIPFKDTKVTLLVDSISEFKEFLLKNNCKIIRDLTQVPTGTNMTAQHRDGTIVEYVEHENQ